MNQKIAIGVLVMIIVGAGYWFFSNQSKQDSLSKESDLPGVLVISDVKVPSTLKVDDGNPQTNEGEFIVTWKVLNDLNPDANAFLNFAIVDETNTEIVGHLYGAGVGATYKDQRWTLQMPPLCTTSPVDSCFAKLAPNTQYRLEAVVVVCSDKNINPMYCGDEARKLTSPAYSNWFNISS